MEKVVEEAFYNAAFGYKLTKADGKRLAAEIMRQAHEIGQLKTDLALSKLDCGAQRELVALLLEKSTP